MWPASASSASEPVVDGADDLDDHHARGHDQDDAQPPPVGSAPRGVPVIVSGAHGLNSRTRSQSAYRPCGVSQTAGSGPCGTIPDGLMSLCTT